ncbi:hypothetical protein OUZ56_014082 [Daphnia magna]|uniref:Uncharacterized protein n=1 Tax=Daphnia magna TaxID=35525 RepID=A0ABQ9Z7U5_9CRUS|nr:hypothetical protein OUZ56_014082 [Daphnia magna]
MGGYYVLLRTVMWLRDSVGRVITSSGGQREIRRWLKKEEWPRVGETAQSNDMLIFIISYSFNVKLRSFKEFRIASTHCVIVSGVAGHEPTDDCDGADSDGKEIVAIMCVRRGGK